MLAQTSQPHATFGPQPFATGLEHWSLAGACAQSQADDRPVVISISTVYQPTGLRSNGEPSPCFPI